MDNGGLRYGAVEGALRPPLPTATQSALHNPTILLGLRRPKIHARLTDPPRRNIIASIRGSERWVAGFKSERWPASDRNRWPASYWNAWPASSESALCANMPKTHDATLVITAALRDNDFALSDHQLQRFLEMVVEIEPDGELGQATAPSARLKVRTRPTKA